MPLKYLLFSVGFTDEFCDQEGCYLSAVYEELMGTDEHILILTLRTTWIME